MENIIHFIIIIMNTIIIIMNTIIIIYCGYINYKEKIRRKKEIEDINNWCDFWIKYHELNFNKLENE